MDEQQKRLLEIAAAWDVWAEAKDNVLRLAQRAEWSGDMPIEGQLHAGTKLVMAQCAEAYARARVQCAIMLANDGVDTVAPFDAHWAERWGTDNADQIARAYGVLFGSTLERLTAGREASRLVSEAHRAAGH